MSWYLWFLAVFFALNGVLVAGSVGEPRKPLTSGTAAFVVVLDALLIVGLFAFGGGEPL